MKKTTKNILLAIGAIIFLVSISLKSQPAKTGEVINNTQAQESQAIKEKQENQEIEEQSEILFDTTNTEALPETETIEQPQTNYYNVVKVVDGDTIKVEINGTTETLRLIGIDTPETVHPTKPVECFGIEASNKAKELLSNQQVSLEYDSSQSTRDKYGRLLAYVHRADGLFYNKWIIENGYAYEYTYNTPYKYQGEFKSAQKYAQDNEIGLWSPDACTIATVTTTTTTTVEPTQPSVIEEQSPIITEPTPQPVPEEQPATTGHIYYTSSYRTATRYYCDTDKGWKQLSKKYLESYSSEAELLAQYPAKTLRKPCK